MRSGKTINVSKCITRRRKEKTHEFCLNIILAMKCAHIRISVLAANEENIRLRAEFAMMVTWELCRVMNFGRKIYADSASRSEERSTEDSLVRSCGQM